MLLIDQLAERRIAEAMDRGELNDLPGAGEPLVLDDDTLVPEALRVAYRVLKNAGFVPPEVELRREIRDVEQLLAGALEGEDRRAAGRRLRYLLTKLSQARGGEGDLGIEAAYREALARRIR